MRTQTTISGPYESTARQESRSPKLSQTTRRYSIPGAKSKKYLIVSSHESKITFEIQNRIRQGRLVLEPRVCLKVHSVNKRQKCQKISCPNKWPHHPRKQMKRRCLLQHQASPKESKTCAPRIRQQSWLLRLTNLSSLLNSASGSRARRLRSRLCMLIYRMPCRPLIRGIIKGKEPWNKWLRLHYVLKCQKIALISAFSIVKMGRHSTTQCPCKIG